MTATMKALRKMQAARGLQMDTVVVPLIGPTDVLVRVKTTSICGTDLHIYGCDRWSQGRIKPPVTLGHEFCGTVERVGDEVRAVKPGDFVSAEMHVGRPDQRHHDRIHLQAAGRLHLPQRLHRRRHLRRSSLNTQISMLAHHIPSATVGARYIVPLFAPSTTSPVR